MKWTIPAHALVDNYQLYVLTSTQINPRGRVIHNLKHKVRQELIEFFDGLVEEKAFQDMPPDVGTTGFNKKKWSPGIEYAGSNVDIWEQTNVHTCAACTLAYKPGAAKCAACGAKLGAAPVLLALLLQRSSSQDLLTMLSSNCRMVVPLAKKDSTLAQTLPRALDQ